MSSVLFLFLIAIIYYIILYYRLVLGETELLLFSHYNNVKLETFQTIGREINTVLYNQKVSSHSGMCQIVIVKCLLL